MGLDSVELLMEIEKYFSIDIPDAEAEKLYTINDMVNAVAAHLNVVSENHHLQNAILLKISQAFKDAGYTNKIPAPDDLLYEYLPDDNNETWKVLKNMTGLIIPEIKFEKEPGKKISDKLKALINWAVIYDPDQISIQQFVDAVCAANYAELIDKNNISSKYEIYTAISGITVDKIAVDYYEIGPDKSFTSDLGVD